MKNKISYSNKVALVLIVVLALSLWGLSTLGSIGKAEETHIGVATQSLKNNFSSIHFNAGGNDFGG